MADSTHAFNAEVLFSSPFPPGDYTLEWVKCSPCNGRGFFLNYDDHRRLPVDETRCGQCRGWGHVLRVTEKKPVQ